MTSCTYWLDQQLEPDKQFTHEGRIPRPRAARIVYPDIPELSAEEREAREDEYLRRCGVDPETGEYLI